MLIDFFICADIYISVLFTGRILQREPVPLHWKILGSFLSGVRPHENGLRAYTGVAAL